ncbi:MAG TPA: hypothetical protein VMW91_04295 [Desulfosporosinus sp.]|nr:hypothetical protein [Desulfosporosinus sp.]
MMKVLLISGKQGSGKSALRRAICDNIVNAVHVSLATPIRMICRYFGDGVDEVNETYELGMDIDVETRQVLNFIATQWGRSVDPQIWAKCAVHKLKTLQTGWKWDDSQIDSKFMAVLDDFRFKNEVELISKHFTVRTLRLECQQHVRNQRAKYWGDPDHISETDLDSGFQFDAVIDSSQPVHETHRQAFECMKQWGYLREEILIGIRPNNKI